MNVNCKHERDPCLMFSMFSQVLFEEKRTLLELNLYASVLPILKKYTLTFQSKDPKVHKLHDEQEMLLREFLCCFMKPQNLLSTQGRNLSGPKIVQLDVTSTKAHLSVPFIGSEATSILKSLRKDHPVVYLFKTKV